MLLANHRTPVYRNSCASLHLQNEITSKTASEYNEIAWNVGVYSKRSAAKNSNCFSFVFSANVVSIIL